MTCFLCQAIPGRLRKSLKMVFYPGQTKPPKSQKEQILVSRKSLRNTLFPSSAWHKKLNFWDVYEIKDNFETNSPLRSKILICEKVSSK